MRPKYIHNFRLDLTADGKTIVVNWRLPPSPSLNVLKKQSELISREKMQFPLLSNIPIIEGQSCIPSQLGRITLDYEPVLPHHVDKPINYIPLEKWPVPRRLKLYPKCEETAKQMEIFRDYNLKNYPWTKEWHFGALPFKTEKLKSNIKRAILDGWTNDCYVPGWVPNDDPSYPGIGLFRKKESTSSTKDWEVIGAYTGQIQTSMEQPLHIMDLQNGIHDYMYSLPG